jgi:hypothetical protein
MALREPIKPFKNQQMNQIEPVAHLSQTQPAYLDEALPFTGANKEANAQKSDEEEMTSRQRRPLE